MGVKENQGELQGARGGDGGVITPPPHGNNTQYSSSIYLGGADFGRGGTETYMVYFMRVMDLLV